MGMVRQGKHIIFLSLIFLLLSLSSFGQEIKVSAGFFSDSVGIGQPTKFYLTARYPSKLNILFPDSTFEFAPFEFNSKIYYPTKTTNDISYDSVIYKLTTFEIDKIQTLSLPVYVVGTYDSTEVSSDRDSISLIELVGVVPDSIPVERLPLKMNTAYYEVTYQFNYIIFSIVAGALILIAVIVLLIFGKRIRKYYKIRRLNKYHKVFMENYSDQLKSVQTSFSSTVSEAALTVWKKYMEQLESKPYTKLTTRELLVVEKDEQLANDLHVIDKAIYGHDTNVVEPFEKLRDYAGARFLKRLDELKHG